MKKTASEQVNDSIWAGAILNDGLPLAAISMMGCGAVEALVRAAELADIPLQRPNHQSGAALVAEADLVALLGVDLARVIVEYKCEFVPANACPRVLAMANELAAIKIADRRGVTFSPDGSQVDRRGLEALSRILDHERGFTLVDYDFVRVTGDILTALREATMSYEWQEPLPLEEPSYVRRTVFDPMQAPPKRPGSMNKPFTIVEDDLEFVARAGLINLRSDSGRKSQAGGHTVVSQWDAYRLLGVPGINTRCRFAHQEMTGLAYAAVYPSS